METALTVMPALAWIMIGGAFFIGLTLGWVVWNRRREVETLVVQLTRMKSSLALSDARIASQQEEISLLKSVSDDHEALEMALVAAERARDAQASELSRMGRDLRVARSERQRLIEAENSVARLENEARHREAADAALQIAKEDLANARNALATCEAEKRAVERRLEDHTGLRRQLMEAHNRQSITEAKLRETEAELTVSRMAHRKERERKQATRAPSQAKAGSETVTACDPAPFAQAPRRLPAPERGRADNLQEIQGIGPALEALLNKLGIFHFAQIAAWTDAEVAWMDSRLTSFSGRVVRDNWIAQARELGLRPVVTHGFEPEKIAAE